MAKTALGLVKYAKAQLGRPYWYGTFGQRSSEQLYEQKAQQYKSFYTATDYKYQYGKKVHDCIGLIKGYIWSKGVNDSSPKYQSNGCPDINEEMMYNNAKVRGSIESMPDKKGILVFKPNHVGVYIGNGEVIEARGHSYGVVKTRFSGRGWTKWCECPYIKYKTAKKKNVKYVVVKTNGSVLNCRKKGNENAKIIGTFANGTRLELIKKTNKNWWKVKGVGITGYCYSQWLRED